MKHKILYHPEEHSNLIAEFLLPIWNEYFDIEPINFDRAYDPRIYSIWTKHLRSHDWHDKWRESGYKIIIDHFWDSATNQLSDRHEQTLTVRMPNWSWYNESLWYQHLGYDSYQRSPNRQYFFLMLMRKISEHRNMILDVMKPFLDSSLYSYVHREKTLIGDLDDTDPRHQRYLNTAWYNDTQFSMVVESTIGVPCFVSEKIFKPMAFQHAFVVWGVPGTLDYLKQQGFETFDHIVDESYDNIQDPVQRLDKIFQEVNVLYQQFQSHTDLFSDAESLARVEHNFHRFYHPQVRDWFVQDAVIPILEFLES